MIYRKNLKFFLLFTFLIALPNLTYSASPRNIFWPVQAVDTVKYSRDLAREKLNNESFDAVINKQVVNIASLGATHIVIATPYDKEFFPFLKRWVNAGRKNNLKIWFRGNWSGWEGWFSYGVISREEHISKTKNFILDNPDLFESGDIFTACPECENGGPTGDPRFSGDVAGHRKFLIDEHNVMASSFKKIGKNVVYNFNSMNGDVARLIMDKATTKALGGVVTIDHYVRTSEKLVSDIKDFSEKSGGKVVLGEIGVPIPDIHGRLNDSEQAKWMDDTLNKLVKMPEVIGINYWLSYGGSTSLWSEKGNIKPIAGTIKNFYKPKLLTGYIMDALDKPISNASIKNGYATSTSESNGYFEIPYIYSESSLNLNISANEYNIKNIAIKNLGDIQEIKLDKIDSGFWFNVVKSIRNFFAFLY